ncbi:MAG: lipopolysaccharide heptosyltransferase II [Pseudomonadota bacterium]
MSETALLVVAPAWVGDLVMSQVLLKHLRQKRPAVAIDVLAPVGVAPLVRRMPEVRKVIEGPFRHGELSLLKRIKLGRKLRSAGYAQALVLPNSWKSALVPWFAGVPIRTGWKGEWRYGLLNDMRALSTQQLPQMAQRFLALGTEHRAPLPSLQSPRLQVDTRMARRLAERLGLQPGRPLLALCPGAAFGGAKRWPVKHFADLAQYYLRRGWQAVVCGGSADRDLAKSLAEQLGQGRCVNSAGLTSLEEVVDVLSLTTAVVSNDSGLMHIAAAVNRPLLALYGPTSPGFTPPLAEHAAILSIPLDCAPCFERECPLAHHRCMNELKPHIAAAKLDELLSVAGGQA